MYAWSHRYNYSLEEQRAGVKRKEACFPAPPLLWSGHQHEPRKSARVRTLLLPTVCPPPEKPSALPGRGESPGALALREADLAL